MKDFKTAEKFLWEAEGKPQMSLNDDRLRIGRQRVLWIMKQYGIELITAYTEFLLESGYCDSDVYCEGNSAIDRFMHKELREK